MQIVIVSAQSFNLDFHVKESRFNFDVQTQIKGQTIHGFLELDFLFSGQGEMIDQSAWGRVHGA